MLLRRGGYQMKHLYTYGLSEEACGALHESFLEPGLHEIEIQDQSGIIFISKFLHTLTRLTGGACGALCLESSTTVVQNGFIKNIYSDLHRCMQQQSNGIECYLLTHFYYDLLIIELSPVSKQLEWVTTFIKLLESLKFTQQIPVLLISYL